MRKNNKKKSTALLWILLAAAALLLIVLLMLIPDQTEVSETTAPESTVPAETTIQVDENQHPVKILKEAIRIDEIGEYTGMYVEDGSDEGVTNMLMMIVTNVTAEPIQYAEIQLNLGEKTAKFTVSVLPAGESAILIEQNRMAYSPDTDYYAAEAECVSLAGFDRELSRCEDKLLIQLMNGGANIKNISGVDIEGTIVICYKNVNNGVYHGGIAYRVRLEDGLKAGELRQIMTGHIQDPGTELMFVEIVE